MSEMELWFAVSPFLYMTDMTPAVIFHRKIRSNQVKLNFDLQPQESSSIRKKNFFHAIMG